MEHTNEVSQSYATQVDHSAMFLDSSPNDNHWQRGPVDDQGLVYGESNQNSGARGRYASPFTRRSMDDSLVATDARMNRIANAEAAMRKEIFKECTFRPNIKDLPSHYGAKKELNIPFHARVSKWHKEREVSLQTKAKTLENQEKTACTFHPKINRNSDKAVKEIRGADFNDDTSMRLYRNSEMTAQQRELMISEIKAKEELALQQECTFKPNLITKNAPVHQSVQSKFTLPPPPKPEPTPHELKECTFTPKVLKIKPTMSSAQTYLSSNVVERLTRPIAAQQAQHDDSSVQHFDPQSATNERPILDMASFMGSLGGTGAKAGDNSFNTPGKPTGGKAGAATESKAKRDAKFEMFLARQQANLKKRADSQKLMERATTPTFKPQLARRVKGSFDTPSKGPAGTTTTATTGTTGAGADSGEGVGESKSGAESGVDFLTRNQMEVERRRAAEQEKRLSTGDENCTFRPKINAKTAAMRSRSITEMSLADHQRKENNRRALKLEAEQSELVNMTFHPKISNLGKEKGKSVLALSSDNTQFLEWLKQSNERKEQKRIEILRQREEAEAKECTFSPQTTECPAYVKRIALSMSIVKAARSSTSGLLDPEASKPQWR